ncbi:MAG: hypothetical protein J6Q65_05165 [Lentisphaeria bacterium]|nr:hypothetical protein [Lentisphaeria bacterium]
MEEYVRNRLRSKLKVASNRQLQYMVSSFILQGIFAFANGETDDAHKMLDTAEMVYNIYKKEHSSAEEQERLRLPPFKEFKRNVVDFVFANFPALSPALKAELELQENNAPPVEK